MGEPRGYTTQAAPPVWPAGVTLPPSVVRGSDVATRYVAEGGNNAHSGQDWERAFADVDAAIAALPSHGGIIEVGYGSFEGFTLKKAGVWVRGRGIGHNTWGEGASESPTEFTTPILIEATEGTTRRSPGSVLEGFSVLSVTGTALTVNLCPELTLRHIGLERATEHGLALKNTYWLYLDGVRCLKNGKDGLHTLEYPINAMLARNCRFDENERGVAIGGGEAMTFLNCSLEANTGFGAQPSNGGPYSWIGCFFGANGKQAYYPTATGGAHILLGNTFTENSKNVNENQVLFRGGAKVAIIGNRFEGTTTSRHVTFNAFEKESNVFQGILSANLSSTGVTHFAEWVPNSPAEAVYIAPADAGNTFNLGAAPITLA